MLCFYTSFRIHGASCIQGLFVKLEHVPSTTASIEAPPGLRNIPVFSMEHCKKVMLTLLLNTVNFTLFYKCCIDWDNSLTEVLLRSFKSPFFRRWILTSDVLNQKRLTSVQFKYALLYTIKTWVSLTLESTM